RRVSVDQDRDGRARRGGQLLAQRNHGTGQTTGAVRRSRERLHHSKTRVAQYLLATGVLVAVAAILPWPGSSGQAATRVRIHLPTVADGIAFAPNSQTILFGSGGIETKIPGPVQDAEAVSVGLDVDGTPVSVRVAQRLTVSGV